MREKMTCLHTKSKQKCSFKLNYLKEIDKGLGNSSSKYDKFIFLDNLNIERTESEKLNFT